MARVLITGSTGLIGRWTLAHRRQDQEFVAVRRDEHDLTDPDAFVAAIDAVAPATVLHLAWCASGVSGYRSSPENDRWLEASWRAALHCLEVGVGFVGTGTVADAGPGTDAYTRSKHELRRRLGGEIDRGAVTWIRPFYTFDPDAGRPALVADARAAVAADRPVELRAPESAHDFVHAADVGAAVVTVVAHGLTGSVDIGSGRLRTVRELARACGAEVRGPARPEDHPDPVDDVAADTTRLRRLGWTPSATESFFGGSAP
ncbi:NAD-dependent epimerase/dehydratase family protein [Marmoricola sp. RAF53]|uniref:NAD-dependent epimerase/dehydratase family protein n=1 Tax=Marmoricola sp. RAF53 TaxID=3233059 RepID=UPI003F9C0E53